MQEIQKKILIIAELGTSHNGDINKAKKMIDAAKDAGADSVKFQIVFADEILHPNTGFVELPGGKISLFDRFKELESPPEFFAEIKEYTESNGLLFLCTPFGHKSAKILKELNPKMVKIASPELNYTSLLKEVSSWNIPILLSTGVSTLSDIERAVEIFKGAGSIFPVPCSLTLLHCVTSYPAPETDYNLRLLPNLANIFGVSVGVSDHSLDPVLVPVIAVAMGASVIEKHFCLSRGDPGLDDPIALEPKDFAIMVNSIREAENRDQKAVIDSLKKERGSNLIESILGDGIKKLAMSENDNYKYTNRSIHSIRDIKKGEVLKREDYAILRSEKNLTPGLEPYWEGKIEGRIARNDIPNGEGIRFEDI